MFIKVVFEQKFYCILWLLNYTSSTSYIFSPIVVKSFMLYPIFSSLKLCINFDFINFRVIIFALEIYTLKISFIAPIHFKFLRGEKCLDCFIDINQKISVFMDIFVLVFYVFLSAFHFSVVRRKEEKSLKRFKKQ